MTSDMTQPPGQPYVPPGLFTDRRHALLRALRGVDLGEVQEMAVATIARANLAESVASLLERAREAGRREVGGGWSAPRPLDPRWLRAGDQIQVVPAFKDSTGGPWATLWEPPSDPAAVGARWMTVVAVLRSTTGDRMAVELEDGSVAEMAGGLDVVQVRIPCVVPE